MKDNFLTKLILIILVLLVITGIVLYSVYSHKEKMAQVQKLNKEYESYYDVNFLGTQVISIINRTIDINEQNGIEKNEYSQYVENDKNSIKIYIKFIYKNEVKEISMEDISSSGSEAFIRTYSTATFKCTNIEYHKQTKNVRSLTFEEIQE